MDPEKIVPIQFSQEPDCGYRVTYNFVSGEELITVVIDDEGVESLWIKSDDINVSADPPKIELVAVLNIQDYYPALENPEHRFDIDIKVIPCTPKLTMASTLSSYIINVGDAPFTVGL